MILDRIALERLQIDAGLTVNALAKKAKVCAGTIYAVKLGRDVRVGTLARLARALDCKPSDLIAKKQKVWGGGNDDGTAK